LLSISKEVQNIVVAVEVRAMAVVEAPPRSPFKIKARKVMGATLSNDVELETISNIENVYCAEKRTHKDISKIVGINNSPPSLVTILETIV